MAFARLSLDSLALTDTHPQVAIRAAADAGFDYCSLWVQAPPLFPSALLSPDKESECAAAIADTGIAVRRSKYSIWRRRLRSIPINSNWNWGAA